MRPVDREILRGQAEHGDLAPVSHAAQHLPQRGRLAGHLEADVEALAHAKLGHDIAEPGVGGVHGQGDADPPGEIQPVLRDVADGDVPGAGVPGHDRRHEADRAGAGDENVLAQDRERQGGVHGVAEGVEDGGDVEVDARLVPPDVRGGQRDVLGEGARAVDPHSLRVRALNPPAGHAVAATAADQVALAAHEVARTQFLHVGPDIHDLAGELVADNQRHRHVRLRPAVPVIDVQVRAADTGSEHTDQNVVAAQRRDRHVLKPEARLRLRLYQRLHRRSRVHDRCRHGRQRLPPLPAAVSRWPEPYLPR